MTLGSLKAHDEGIVTACSVVANGRAFEPAIDLLRDRPGLDVGIHLTLVGETPLAPPERVPSLVDRNGAFLGDFKAFTRRYLLAVLSRHGGRVTDAARGAHMKRESLHRLLRRHHVIADDFREY